MSYAGNWHGSGQIPARAVEQRAGLALRLDRSRRGRQHRAPPARRCSTSCGRPRTASSTRSPTPATYRFNLFSNFTLFLRDPDNGDEIEQVDRRTFYGGRAQLPGRAPARAVSRSTRPSAATCAATTSTRSSGTRVHRQQLAAVRNNDVHETLIGAYVNEEITPLRWLRLDVGGRADLIVVRRRQPADATATRRRPSAASAPRTSSARRRA